MPHPGNPYTGASKPFRFNELPERVRGKIRTRGAKATACWIWTGTIRPARRRPRPSRYVSRMHEKFEEHVTFENVPALPEVWDSRAGKKVAAHRLVRSILTCVPIEAVPRLIRCHDARCVSPWHNMEIGPPTVPLASLETAAPVPTPLTETGGAVDVLAVLKEHRPLAELGEAEFPLIEEECGLPAGSVTMPIWVKYVAWDEENPEP